MNIQDLKPGLRVKVAKPAVPEQDQGLVWCPEYEGRTGIVHRVGAREVQFRDGLWYRASWLEPLPFAKGDRVKIGPAVPGRLPCGVCVSPDEVGTEATVCGEPEKCGCIYVKLDSGAMVPKNPTMLEPVLEAPVEVRQERAKALQRVTAERDAAIRDRDLAQKALYETQCGIANFTARNAETEKKLADRDRRLAEAAEILEKMKASLERLRPKTLAEHAFAIRESFAHGLEAGAAARGAVIRFARRCGPAAAAFLFGSALYVAGILTAIEGSRPTRDVAPVTTWARGVY